MLPHHPLKIQGYWRSPASACSARPSWHVSLPLFVPHAYWITSSAKTRRDGGIVIPRALAVLRLMTSWNLVGCSTGRSAGLVPFRILSTYVAARRQFAGESGP